MTSPTALKLLVGLGNPGQQYRETRHNAGFWFLDEVAFRCGIGFRPDSRSGGETAVWESGNGVVRLLKPMGYMNRSGLAVAALARFYQIPAAGILVAHDDLDFPPGVVRLKIGGGHGGHNGLRDIIAQLGVNGFARLRIGIGRPLDREQTVPYVLSKPSLEERLAIREAIERAAGFLPELLAGELSATMNRLNAA